jgi:putative tryptophan/tyrosine transport system substrate-binding protein
MRRVGVLMGYAETDPEGRARVASLREEPQKLGWAEGRNFRIDTRWATPGDTEPRQRFTQELVALRPDLILSHGTPGTAMLLQAGCHRALRTLARPGRDRPISEVDPSPAANRYALMP